MPLCVGEGPAETDNVGETIDKFDVDVGVGADDDFGAGPRPKFSSTQ